MDKIKQISDLSKCGAFVQINPHKSYYQTAKETIDESEIDEIEQGVYDKICETDSLIIVQAYPNTPVSFHMVYHYDLEHALDKMIDLLS